MSNLRFGWGFFRDLIDWTPATVAAYGQPQVKAEFLALASEAQVTVAPAVTAFAGGGQGSATAITLDFSNITVCATAGDSVKLPAATVGKTFTITNRGAASANVFPATGDTINGGSANAAIALPVGATIQFVAINTTDWKTGSVTLPVAVDIAFAKEVNHAVTVTTTTTAATAGGNLSVTAGQGATSGAGGNVSLVSGAGGATGAGGIVAVTSGAGGATSGASGAVNVSSGSATVGSSGTLTVSSGNTASGVAGDVVLTTGTHTSTTVSPVVSLNKAVVRKPNSSTVASGATITGVELVGGLIAATGATGNWQLPTTAQITTAIGSTPAGTYFEFIFNAAAMTATNTATLVVGTNMTVQSSPAITGGGALTVTQDTQVIGRFGIYFDTATTCKIVRIS